MLKHRRCHNLAAPCRRRRGVTGLRRATGRRGKGNGSWTSRAATAACSAGPRGAASSTTASSTRWATRPACGSTGSRPTHVTIYVKCEFFNPAASVKDRLALNIIEAAERDGTLKPGQTVVEATSGNTGIGLAMVCAAKGYPLVVTMADSFSVERRQLMRFLGAKVVLTPRAQKGFGMYMKAKELADTNGWFLARQFETPANADIHESTTAAEILADFEGQRLDYFVSGYGTGGTVAGVGRVLKKTWPRGEDHPLRAGQRPARRLGNAAGSATADGAPAGEPSGLRAAPDPGLDAGLHPAGAAGGDRRALLRRAHPDRRPPRA